MYTIKQIDIHQLSTIHYPRVNFQLRAMGNYVGKAMEENLAKQQQFMLEMNRQFDLNKGAFGEGGLGEL